jgi:hypothetical protein
MVYIAFYIGQSLVFESPICYSATCKAERSFRKTIQTSEESKMEVFVFRNPTLEKGAIYV